MAEQNYGAAQPIYDVGKNIYDKVTSFIKPAPAPAPAVSNTYNDDYQKAMLKRAQDSFKPETVRKVAPQTTVAPINSKSTVRTKMNTRKVINTKR